MLPFTSQTEKAQRKHGPWSVGYSKSHILHSKCSQDEATCALSPCNFCTYSKALELRHLPDMVFPENLLKLTHDLGGEIEFNALDALKCVNPGKYITEQKGSSEEKTNDNNKFIKKWVEQFDWTFTTNYMGTLRNIEVEETEQRIDFEALMKKDAILFYNDFTLYEDEVHDRGTASLSVKIRIMMKSIFILLRYFLRIDHSIIRINDTRIHHNFEDSYLLREYTSRECKIKDLNCPERMLLDVSVIASQVPIQGCSYHKLIINSNDKKNSTESTEKNPTESTEKNSTESTEKNETKK